MQVIGLTGFAGSGKSTVANYLVEAHGFTRLSFAAPLKKMLRTLNPILGTDSGDDQCRLSELFEHWDENFIKSSKYGNEYRRLLQVLGTDCIRAVDEDFWVKAAVAQMTDPDGKYVFDDVRFPNEAEVIKGYHPRGLWNVSREGYGAVNGHESEKHAGNMGEGIFLWNSSEMDQLQCEVDECLVLAYDIAGV